MPSIGPRIIVQCKVGTGLHGGVAVLPELDEGAGVGIFKPGLAQGIESGHGGFLWIGDNTMNSFLSVDIGLMLKVAAEGIAGRRQQKADY